MQISQVKKRCFQLEALAALIELSIMNLTSHEERCQREIRNSSHQGKPFSKKNIMAYESLCVFMVVEIIPRTSA